LSPLSDSNISLDKAFLEQVIIVGEFMPSDSKPKILEESVVTESLLNRFATFSKYYRATLSFPVSDKIISAELEFNANAKSWGYSYVAHRFKKESKHQFVISILVANDEICRGEKSYRCAGIFRSTEFQIQCKRRAHNEPVQVAPFSQIRAVNENEVGCSNFSFYF
jgi:KaiC/GvpD/RAD55 family RecA-like ATPase